MACKAAIKAGYKLSVDEVNELFKMIDGNMGLKCPHGRPISVKISRNELEKWFKRIT
jgi:DNA mismatch repair protein MutL